MFMSTKKNCSPKFVEYMDFIVNHPNYKGLAINKTNNSYGWVTTKKSDIGKSRLEWANKKAKELNIKQKPGYLRTVMFKIHPTKMKPCQVCGKVLSLNYIYLNKPFVNLLNKKFNYNFNELDSIYDVADVLKRKGVNEDLIKKCFISLFKLNNDYDNSMDIIIKECIQKCSDGFSKYLGPGAMSNFPDRFDGFHSYNRCCRSKEDTGRSKENLSTYNKDRRAYEYWSDGNIFAANKFMKSNFFRGTSADHIGPISLGFIHDPRQLRKLNKKDNSSKRDRLQYNDIIELEKVEDINNICVINWYSDLIWEFIKKNLDKSSDLELFRKMLKTNLQYYMELLWNIIDKCNDKGIKFLTKKFLEPKYRDFKFDYEFNDLGQIINKYPRHETDASHKEFDRFVRISFESVKKFHEKENRKTNIKFSSKQMVTVNLICEMINDDNNDELIFDVMKEFVSSIELNIIKAKE